MGESEETIRARKDVAKAHLKDNWRRGMKQKEARVLLSAHAKSIAIPNLYDCVFKDDPDFLGDVLVEVSDEISAGRHGTSSIASLCEPLTAATLEENERSFRGDRSIASGNNRSRQDTKSPGSKEPTGEAPSYDEELSGAEFNVVFLHPERGEWKFLRARNCKERRSFISCEAVSQFKLASCTKTINGVPTVELTCRPCGQGSGSESRKTFVTFFRIVENEKLTNDVAVGTDAWREVDTPPHSDSGFNEPESAESVGSAGQDRTPYPHYDHEQLDVYSRIGRLTQDAAALGAYMAYAQSHSSPGPMSTKPGSMQLPSKPKTHAQKGG